ncbi:hypothetical protein MGK_02062 [Candida albicans P57055]|nr:hypothetical protein MGK_02062 [Candida albicans P57055]
MGGGLTSLTSFASFSSLAMHDSKRYRNLVVKKKTRANINTYTNNSYYSPSIVHHNESVTFRNFTRRTRG